MKIKNLIHFVFAASLFLSLAGYLQAGHLPTKSYTTFDGLANDSVNRIIRDSRGFLWFCTGEGLSRFDGFEFKNYTQNEGLPHRNINDFLETKNGDLLVATTDGLAIFNPDGTAYRWNILTSGLEQNSADPPMFRTFHTPNPNDDPRARSILTLTESRDGRIFAGTGAGLFRLEKRGDEWTFLQVPSTVFDENTQFTALQFDSAGFLWLVTSAGIYRMSPEGAIGKVDAEGGGSVLVDNQGQIWVGASGTSSGLRLFTISVDGQTPQLKKVYRTTDGLPFDNPMADILQTAGGRILVIAGDTVCEFLPDAVEDKPKFRIIARGSFQSLAEDSGGNLWLGTVQEGAWKLFPGGFIKFDESDGIPKADITSLFTNSDGEIFITGGKQKILRFSGGRFEAVVPNGLEARSWGTGQLDFQAANGEWWVSSTTGLRLYPKLKNFDALDSASPKKIYTTADGLFGNEIFNLFQDSHNDIWLTNLNTPGSLQRLEPKTGKIYRYPVTDGLPKSNGVVAFAEDKSGNVWLGFYFGGLARYKNGGFQFFTAADGVPVSSIKRIFSDKSGRLWVATASRGVFRIDDPAAENPKFVNLSTTEGLSSNQTNCVTEDNFGQIYIGTGRGVNRIDPASGHIKLYTQADGLPGTVVSLCMADKNGSLWFVSRNSLVRFTPQPALSLPSPPVFIGGISVNGVARKISQLGAKNIEKMNFASDQNQIKIDFFAFGFGTGDRLHYQYRLDSQEWSPPGEQKSVTFNLASGDYRFEVRAVNADGVGSLQPVVFSFTIAQPFYRRWWFILLASLLVGGFILVIERTRAARLRTLKDAFGKLSVSEQRFRRMIEQSSLGIVIFSPDGRLRSVNRAYEKFWNISFGQIKDWKMLEDEQLVKSGVTEKLQQAFEGENVFIPPVAYDPQNNSAGVSVDVLDKPRWIQSFAYPVKSETGELLEVIMVMEDVTETKNSEDKLQAAREERFRELEQVRRRIAADLHDDIGSSLTQISIFSEVLQQRIDKTNERVMEPLEFIAHSSRELVDAMSDIVWAINPQKDFLSELNGKMRRFAADVFTARNIELKYTAAPTEDIALGANLRREVFLIFKESVNNIVKHSKCTVVEIELNIENTGENAEIRLKLQDNGKGFETNGQGSGHGLVNMKLRAEGLDGKIEIVSEKSVGTSVMLIIPLTANLIDADN